MAQKDNKTRQKGTNAMFVMTHNEIRHVLQQGKKITYGNPVINYHAQKEDPHQTRITAGGNMVQYISSLAVNTAELDTAKLLWNSIISTKGVRHICLGIIFLPDSTL
jgi:hypothetical protein